MITRVYKGKEHVEVEFAVSIGISNLSLMFNADKDFCVSRSLVSSSLVHQNAYHLEFFL